MRFHNYFVYILTNKIRTVLYTGVSNDLHRRIYEHKNALLGGFTKKYKCHYLIYYEHFQQIEHAIDREKQIKNWSRKKKEFIINQFNSEWKFLNDEIGEL